jgi:hypothetical protein
MMKDDFPAKQRRSVGAFFVIARYNKSRLIAIS